MEYAARCGWPRNPCEGKKTVVSYFSLPVNETLRRLGLDHHISRQTLLGEVIDDLVHKCSFL